MGAYSPPQKVSSIAEDFSDWTNAHLCMACPEGLEYTDIVSLVRELQKRLYVEELERKHGN